jgi:hypothetical protein
MKTTSTPPAASLGVFLQTLFADLTGLLEIRALPSTARTFCRLNDSHTLTAFLGDHLRENLFFGPGTRHDATSGTLENCVELPALFGDFDFKDHPEQDVRKALAEFPLPPSIIVNSGGGLHAYWLLNEPFDLRIEPDRQRARNLLRRLAIYLHADLNSAEPARVLRVPGTRNFKYDPPRDVVTEAFDQERRYNDDDFDTLLPVEPLTNGQRPAFHMPEAIPNGQRQDTLYRLARSLKVRGLSNPAILAALREENRLRCQPPLDEAEVLDTVHHAMTQADRPEFLQNGHPETPDDVAPSSPAPQHESAPVPFSLTTPEDSFISRYVAYAASRTDAPLEAHEGLAFAVLSALASTLRLPIATAVKGWLLTIWILYLVNTTAGRKSTTLELAVDFIRSLLGKAALLNWEGSPQGFIQRLQERDGQATVFVRDEYASLLTAINRGGHLTGLPQVLIKAYDGSVIENVRTKKRNSDGAKLADTDRAEAPYLAQCAAAPWDAFVQAATIDNVNDGFLPRFIIITGQAAGRALQPITPDIRAQREALLDQLRTYQAQVQAIETVAFAPGVLEAQWAFEQSLLARASESSRPDAAGPVLKRLADTALKLTALLAVEQATGTVLTLTLAQFAMAATITRRWADNALRLVEALGRTTFRKHCEEVLRTVRMQPTGLSVSTLYRKHPNLRERDFHEILGALETQEHIAVEKTEPTGKKGRLATMVRPLTKGK